MTNALRKAAVVAGLGVMTGLLSAGQVIGTRARTFARSNSPLAPHPVSPTGTDGRNCSYSRNPRRWRSAGPQLAARAAAAARVGRLIETWRFGRRIRFPWNTTLADSVSDASTTVDCSLREGGGRRPPNDRIA